MISMNFLAVNQDHSKTIEGLNPCQNPSSKSFLLSQRLLQEPFNLTPRKLQDRFISEHIEVAFLRSLDEK